MHRTQQFIFKNECMFGSYRLVKNEDQPEKILGLLVSAQLTTLLNNKMRNEENFLILQNSVRLIWNCVPDDGNRNYKELSDNLLNNSNYLQPHEVLGGHCIAEFILNNENLLSNIEQAVNKKS